DPEGQIEAGVVIAPLECSHGLGVDPDPLGERGPTELMLGTQHRDSIEDGKLFSPSGWGHATQCCVNPTFCQRRNQSSVAHMTNGIHDIAFTTIDGEQASFGDYAGHAVLVVNVASECGLTPQYEGL